jgi:hypothetical protein
MRKSLNSTVNLSKICCHTLNDLPRVSNDFVLVLAIQLLTSGRLQKYLGVYFSEIGCKNGI